MQKQVQGEIVNQILHHFPHEVIRYEDKCLKFNVKSLNDRDINYLCRFVPGDKTIKRSGNGLLIVIEERSKHEV